MDKKRFALVGTGIRSQYYVDSIAHHRDSSELVAFCDLSPTRMAYANERLAGALGYPAVPTYAADQFERMVREQRPGWIIITSKDSTHHEYIGRALRAGCNVVTEKPMTIDAAKCRAVFEAVEETRRSVRVAFNYRWSPHRTKVKELILQGAIGKVKHVHVEYLLNTSHGTDYYRRWHATMADSGGLLVHKSTHHFDLVNWWLDGIPEQVFAYGRLDFYGRANAIARGDEAFTRYDRYTGQPAAAGDPFAFDLGKDESTRKMYLNAEAESGYLRDRNVFREGIDIYDNMTAVVRYRGGQLMAYSLLCFSPREGMRVGLDGDRGRIEYREILPTHIRKDAEPKERCAEDKGTEEIRVYPLFKPSYDVPVATLEGGHNGSDPVMANHFFGPSPGTDPFARPAGHEQGAASILVGVAANQSIATNRPVNLLDLVKLKPGATRLSELDLSRPTMPAGTAASVLDAIGETPLVELSRIARGVEGRILGKLEYLNPGFSKKDRIARQIVEDAEARGALAPGQAVVELTSGNTGTGLAIVCAIKRHPFVAVMSRGNSPERARMMAALGAEVVLVDQRPGSEPGRVSGGDLDLVEEAARRIARERGAFRADQFALDSNARAHLLHTGPEFLRQSDGRIDAFCDFVGSGGSFGGCAAAFKRHDPAIRCYVVEPAGAAALAGRPVTRPGHRIQGGGYSRTRLAQIDPALIDGYLEVTDEEAIETTRRLAKEEGVFAGVSSGANVAAALRLLRTSCRGKTVAVLLCDSGLKYLSTDLWP